jgi:hypothetical protein
MKASLEFDLSNSDERKKHENAMNAESLRELNSKLLGIIAAFDGFSASQIMQYLNSQLFTQAEGLRKDYTNENYNYRAFDDAREKAYKMNDELVELRKWKRDHEQR